MRSTDSGTSPLWADDDEVFCVHPGGPRVVGPQAIRLAFAGSHSRGAIFRNGTHLVTPQMEARFDAIAKALPEFHFGRFDVRFKLWDAVKGDDLLGQSKVVLAADLRLAAHRIALNRAVKMLPWGVALGLLVAACSLLTSLAWALPLPLAVASGELVGPSLPCTFRRKLFSPGCSQLRSVPVVVGIRPSSVTLVIE